MEEWDEIPGGITI